MERLLADAQELTGVEYDISNLDDVFMAVHAIQEEIGITGTTALEAEETIEGSLNAMKAAFANTMGALAIGENVEGSFQALAETASTFLFDNLLPMIGEVISNLPMAIEAFTEAAIPLLLDSGGTLLSSLSEGITEGIPAFFETMAEFMSNVVTWIQEQLPTILSEGVAFITEFATGIFDGAPDVIDNIGEILNNVLTAIFEALPMILESGMEIISNLAKGIWDNLPEIVESITDIIGGLLDTILSYMPDLLRKGMELVGELAMGIWDNLPEIISKMSDLLGKVIEKIGGYLPKFLSEGLKLIGEMALGIVNAIPGIVAKIPQVIRALIGAFKNIGSKFKSIGSDIVKGLWNGINSVKDWIMSKISGFVSGITGGIKKFFGIKSPSKVMADEIGQWIPAGLAEGIEDNVKPVTDAMSDLTDLTTGTMTSELAMTGSMSMNNSAVAREDTTLGRLEQLFDNLTNQKQFIVLDTGELVGATYPQYDRVGGSQTQLTERWGR